MGIIDAIVSPLFTVLTEFFPGINFTTENLKKNFAYYKGVKEREEKLHVGVVGGALGKCVVSFPVHREKTNNFFKMIAESERCIHVRSLDSQTVYEQLVKFHNKPVHIPEEMRVRASKNLSVIKEIS